MALIVSFEVTPAPSAAAAPSSSATSEPPADNGSFKPVGNQRETQSGEALVVEAYAAIWLALMVFVALAWKRTRGLEEKVVGLESAVQKAQIAATPSTKRSGDKPAAARAGAAQPVTTSSNEDTDD